MHPCDLLDPPPGRIASLARFLHVARVARVVRLRVGAHRVGFAGVVRVARCARVVASRVPRVIVPSLPAGSHIFASSLACSVRRVLAGLSGVRSRARWRLRLLVTGAWAYSLCQILHYA